MIRGARGADTTPRSSDDRQARFSRFVTSTKYLAGQTVQPFESLAHCGDSGGQIDPWGWTQSQRLTPGPAHSPRARTYSIKIRMHLDPTRGRRHHGQPATRFVRRLRFPGGQLHRHQPTGRRSARLLFFQCCFLRCRLACRSVTADCDKTRSLTNTPIRMAGSMLKSPDDRKKQSCRHPGDVLVRKFNS